jgi:flavin reductase (DIM6/NTAB) family NADH-FMN oxidoreductase RutF
MAITSEDFRDALRHFPAGVTLVTLKSGDRVHGLTVSAFASVTPSPPLIAVIIDRRNTAHPLLEEEGAVFAVNILGEDQAELSNRFAWLKDADRFAEGNWTTAQTGAPILEDAIAWLDCTIHSRLDAGTHTIYLGKVQATGLPRADYSPLVYWNRGYRRLDRTPPEEKVRQSGAAVKTDNAAGDESTGSNS